MAYTAITAGEVDLDSPITEGLGQKTRDNQAYHQARFDNSSGHKHSNGTDDGAPITDFPEDVVADGAITVSGTLTAQFAGNYGALFGLW